MSDSATKSEFDPPKGKLKNLRTLWSFMLPYKTQILLASFFLIIAAGTVLAIPSALEGIVDSFTEDTSNSINDYLALLVGTVIVMALATAFRFYFITWLGERVVADIRKAVYERLITLSPEFFEVNRPGEIVSRLTADTTLVQSIVGSSVSIWARNTLIAIAGTIWLFIMSPKLMGLISIVIPIIIAIIVIVGRRVRTLSRTSQDKVADVGAQAAESLSALNIVQAFTQENTEAKRFGGRVDEAFFAARRRIRVRAFLTAAIIFLVFGAIALVIYQGFQDVSAGVMTSGEMTAFIFRAVLVAGAFGALSEVYSELQRAAGAAGRLAELLNAESAIETPANAVAMPDTVKGHIVFDKVNFAYPSKQSEQALKNFSLNIKPGETVALVGPSGAGKSTVLQLLLRFYDPQNGNITIDGTDIAATDPTNFREHLAFVPQETIVFADTVAGNIRYGRQSASDDEVLKAAEAAAAREFIERTDDGFDTFLGERGTRLSGGQRQRIAIARAILRDSPILLLDEATSALDAESELKVQTALDRLMEGRTTLVIAHRLATVKKADRIIVMEDGKIVAEGTHEELSKQDGLYKRLADLQFGGN
ncbi:ABC transporter transmembrane domain-containing protein [Kordiimonas sp. SCSIO 12610]|uniref:ABC transporter transmembrane domain-containing protein n=1 Tax=Kordiimonas sp. SCSIO 12610 TaxID=2829597 RepID=UPI00210A6C8B|nr:ABC transporter transmembrane domain-containing protein [Kordiimonas sp. SCSIO 12610]UTW55800.1 ATP-binding cassette domain-containing protein [Kordiimonas sp. SCSIO 12610]